MSSWLDPKNIQGGGDHEAQASQRVATAAKKLNDPLLPIAVGIYNDTMRYSDVPDEFLGPAERFSGLFNSRHQDLLNHGVVSLDFVRECVRRSFGISQIVPYGDEGNKRRWVTDEQIEEIANELVTAGYVLPSK